MTVDYDAESDGRIEAALQELRGEQRGVPAAMKAHLAIMNAQLNAVRQLHKAHPMPFDVSSPTVYNVDARTNVCRHCSVMKGVPVVWPCETAAYANADLDQLPASLLPEGEDEWTY